MNNKCKRTNVEVNANKFLEFYDAKNAFEFWCRMSSSRAIKFLKHVGTYKDGITQTSSAEQSNLAHR